MSDDRHRKKEVRLANGLRRDTERYACGNLALREKDGPCCARCLDIEARLGNDYTKRNSGVPGYHADPYHVLGLVLS